MTLEQIYTGCLAQGAYYIASNGEAVIIDPLREIQPYLDRLEKDKVKRKYIFETHFHADFVSGHIDLAKATGATIVFGPTSMTLGFDRTSAGVPSAMVAPKSSTVMRSHRLMTSCM